MKNFNTISLKYAKKCVEMRLVRYMESGNTAEYSTHCFIYIGKNYKWNMEIYVSWYLSMFCFKFPFFQTQNTVKPEIRLKKLKVQKSKNC